MTDQAVQIIARGPRAQAEAAAAAVDANLRLEGAAYSILEEDEARDVWRIDAFPTSDDEADAFEHTLKGFADLRVAREFLADVARSPFLEAPPLPRRPFAPWSDWDSSIRCLPPADATARVAMCQKKPAWWNTREGIRPRRLTRQTGLPTQPGCP